MSDAELAAHVQAKREFDACMEKRLAAMRDAMALPDVDAQNATIRAIPICLEPEPLALPPIAIGPLAPPSLASPAEADEPVAPRPVKRHYREYVVITNLGSVAVMAAGFAVDQRLGIAGAAVFTLASPAVHYYFGNKESIAPSLLLHGLGAGAAIYLASTIHSHECVEEDVFCLGAASDATRDAVKIVLGGAAGTILITAIDARFLAKRDVYVAPTFAPSQGTAGISLAGTF